MVHMPQAAFVCDSQQIREGASSTVVDQAGKREQNRKGKGTRTACWEGTGLNLAGVPAKGWPHYSSHFVGDYYQVSKKVSTRGLWHPRVPQDPLKSAAKCEEITS